MDGKSFIDHSDDIANAVRRAMLNMHPINGGRGEPVIPGPPFLY